MTKPVGVQANVKRRLLCRSVIERACGMIFLNTNPGRLGSLICFGCYRIYRLAYQDGMYTRQTSTLSLKGAIDNLHPLQSFFCPVVLLRS